MLSGMVIVALTAAMLAYLTKLVERKESYNIYGPFYEQQESFDVLFLGSSHVRQAVLPMELWHDHGIISYNLASAGNFLPTTYWAMRDYIEIAKPKLVVIDCYFLSLDLKGNDTIAKTHNTLDLLPLGKNKVDAVMDMFAGTGYEFEFIWDFALYHDRWKELTKNDFLPSMNVKKNGVAEAALGTPLQFPKASDDYILEEDTVGVTFLRKMIEECQAKDIEVLLVYFPFPADTVQQGEANRAALIAEEYGVEYINFLNTGTVDYRIDLRDSGVLPAPMGANGHMNFSGANKITEFLGDYIADNYDIPDRRDDSDYAGWYDDYKVYKRNKISTLNKQTQLMYYLVLCRDKHFDYCVYLTDAILQLKDEVLELQLENMGIDLTVLQDNEHALAVVDNSAGTTLCLAPGEAAEAGFGRVDFEEDSGSYKAALDGTELMPVSDSADIGIAVIDSETKKVVNSTMFAIGREKVTVTKIS